MSLTRVPPAAGLPVVRRRVLLGRSMIEQWGPPGVLALAVGLLFALVRPTGEFPIDDDWLYARVVQTFVEQGRLTVPAWTAASLVLQALWGGLFAYLFGFSHEILRVSTLVLSVAGVFGFYLLLREMVGPGPALLRGLLLWFNPLWVMLSYSFMTNVPFLALVLWALYCDVRALRAPVGGGVTRAEPSSGWLWAGSVFAGMAFLVRQLGVIPPVAVLVWLVVNHGWRDSLRPGRLMAIFGPVLLAMIVGWYFGQQRGLVFEDPIGLTLHFWATHGLTTVGIVLARATESFATLGLYALPLSLGGLLAGSARGLGRVRSWLAGALVLLLGAGFLLHCTLLGKSPWFPYIGNTVGRTGFLTTRVFDRGVPHSTVVPEWGIVAGTLAALLGAILLILASVRALSWETFRRPVAVPLLFGLLAFGLTLVYHEFYDNYLLSILPSVLLLSLPAYRWSRLSYGLALAGLAFVATWSIWWGRDYFERRSALWQAGQELAERGIPPEQIDGGREWVAWYRGQAAIAEAVRQVQAGKRSSLTSGFFRDLELPNPRWVVVYGPASKTVGGVVLATVGYARGQYVQAIQRY